MGGGRQRSTVVPAAYLFIVRAGRTLLLKRCNTGYYDGSHGVIAGHVEGGESATATACREAAEEAGIRIAPADLRFVHAMYRSASDGRVDFFFEAVRFAGEPRNMEPEKCDQMEWFPVDALPGTMVPYVCRAFGHWRAGIAYSEDGWD
jgi:8-oxo-dGTP diphosphatase